MVKLSIGGVSLILTDVRFGLFSQNLVTFDDGVYSLHHQTMYFSMWMMMVVMMTMLELW